ncbi:hypothetical protein D3C87_1948280 [compost metagenome]
MYSVVGGTDEECGRIAWHPDVVKAAEATGLVYGKDGYITETEADKAEHRAAD